MKRTSNFRNVGVLLFCLVSFCLAELANAGNITLDFSSDPGLQTNNSSRFFIADGVFEANSFTNSQEYGTFPVAYDGGDFTYSFDIKVLDRTTGDANIGLFSSSRQSNRVAGDPTDPAIYVFYGGFEQGLGLRGRDANGDFFSIPGGDPTSFGPFDLNTVYHNEVAYDATTRIVTLSVSSPTDSNFFSGSVSVPGGLPTLSHLGVSSVGSWISTGRFQRVQIDNVSATGISAVPEPSSLALLGIGLVTVIGCGWRRKRSPIAAPKS